MLCRGLVQINCIGLQLSLGTVQGSLAEQVLASFERRYYGEIAGKQSRG